MLDANDATSWSFDRPPRGRLVSWWSGGGYESALRPFTRHVEGRIASRHHLLMVTLKGGAERHRFSTDAGFSFEGSDSIGTVSFLPAGCGRELSLENVCWEWGAIAIDPKSASLELDHLAPFTSQHEPFLAGLVGQMQQLLIVDGTLDEAYCDAMALALCHHLVRRHDPARMRGMRAPHSLSPRQLRETLDRIEAMLSGAVKVRDLAHPLGLSEGHFHRAFRGSTGKTPLETITLRRVDRAARLLAETKLSVTEIAFEVGLSSPSHLSRLFKERTGLSPCAWRRETAP